MYGIMFARIVRSMRSSQAGNLLKYSNQPNYDSYVPNMITGTFCHSLYIHSIERSSTAKAESINSLLEISFIPEEPLIPCMGSLQYLHRKSIKKKEANGGSELLVVIVFSSHPPIYTAKDFSSNQNIYSILVVLLYISDGTILPEHEAVDFILYGCLLLSPRISGTRFIHSA